MYKKMWLIKLVCAVSVLFAAVRFAVPVSEVLVTSFTFFQTEANYRSEGTAENMNAYTEAVSEPDNTDIYEPVTEEEQADLQHTDSSYETPEDVLAFEQEYLAAFAQSAAAGITQEVLFRETGATDIIGGISVKNATATKKPDFLSLMNEGISLDITDKSEPLVLIFHTHTTETYLLSDNGVFYEDYQSRSKDNAKNMVRVGAEICRVLENNGIGYIHDTAVYDESYEGAYGRSRVSVEKYLRQYPSIQIVLDVHRDAIYYSDTSRCKPTALIDGRKAAQIMIITGAQEGYITDFAGWEDNLKFALCFQKAAEEAYSGLMKPLYFCQRKYNMDLGRYSLLFEMGTDANTLDEALYSANLTGHILSEIINGCVVE